MIIVIMEKLNKTVNKERRTCMHNLIAVGIFMLLLFAGIGLLLAGLGVYYWGKGKGESASQKRVD